jgi:hypothetical protein
MNAVLHAEISVKRRGGTIEDYYAIHDFMDCTKELCSDNRHRILHTLWGIKRVIVPIFGHTIVNSAGKKINVKDLCEQDHILPDYQNKFIPNLSDFVAAIDEIPNFTEKIKAFYKFYEHDDELRELLLSPLANTGKINALALTHNSWFLNEIVPKILKRPIILDDFPLSPSDFFDNMRFEPWMDNGSFLPNSAVKIQ